MKQFIISKEQFVKKMNEISDKYIKQNKWIDSVAKVIGSDFYNYFYENDITEILINEFERALTGQDSFFLNYYVFERNCNLDTKVELKYAINTITMEIKDWGDVYELMWKVTYDRDRLKGIEFL